MVHLVMLSLNSILKISRKDGSQKLARYSLSPELPKNGKEKKLNSEQTEHLNRRLYLLWSLMSPSGKTIGFVLRTSSAQ